MNIGSPAKKIPFKAIQLKDSVRAMWSNYFPSTGRPRNKIQDKFRQQYRPEAQRFFTYEHFPRNPNYTEKFPPAVKMKTEYEEPLPKNPPLVQDAPTNGNETKKSADTNAYYDYRIQPQPFPPQNPQQYETQPTNQKYLSQGTYQQPNVYYGYQYPYGNIEYPPYQVPPQYMPQGPQGSQYMPYQQQQQQQALWPVQLDAERQMYQPAPADPYLGPESQYIPPEQAYQTPVQQAHWPWQTEDEKRVYQAAAANPYQVQENQYLPPAQPYQQAQWPWASEDERRAYENALLANGAILSRNMGGQNMGGPSVPVQGVGGLETRNMGYDPRGNSFEPDVLYPNVLSPIEMNPLPDYNKRNSTVIIPSLQDFNYQFYGFPHPLAKRDESTRRSLHYPKCFVVSDKHWPLLGKFQTSMHKRNENGGSLPKQKRSDNELKLPYWPLLGTIGKLGPRNSRQDRGGKFGKVTNQVNSLDNPGALFFNKSSLVCLADNTRNLEMNIVRKLSELKAKEHIAGAQRQTMMHRTEEAKEDFQEKIGDQMSLVSEARKADISAKAALDRVVRLERELAQEDKALHRLKEEEDALYQELLQSEAQVAMADMQIIPRLPTADDLTEFLTG